MRPTLLALEDRRLLSTFTVQPAPTTPSAGRPARCAGPIAEANAASSASTIDFNVDFASDDHAVQWRTRAEQLQVCDHDHGPGANLLSVNGNNASSVFKVDDGVTASLTA